MALLEEVITTSMTNLAPRLGTTPEEAHITASTNYLVVVCFHSVVVFVYGLIVYLPACTVPVDRGAKPIRWWHYPLAVILPLLAAVPVALLVVLVRQ